MPTKPSRPINDDGDTYDDEERDFILAMERWMRVTGRKFPSFTEVLAVAKALGYRKAAPAKEKT